GEPSAVTIELRRWFSRLTSAIRSQVPLSVPHAPSACCPSPKKRPENHPDNPDPPVGCEIPVPGVPTSPVFGESKTAFGTFRMPGTAVSVPVTVTLPTDRAVARARTLVAPDISQSNRPFPVKDESEVESPFTWQAIASHVVAPSIDCSVTTVPVQVPESWILA